MSCYKFLLASRADFSSGFTNLEVLEASFSQSLAYLTVLAVLRKAFFGNFTLKRKILMKFKLYFILFYYLLNTLFFNSLNYNTRLHLNFILILHL